MKHGPTLFLKAVIVLIGLVALTFCVLWLPGAASRDAELHPKTAYLQYPFLICSYLMSIPFFIALYRAFQLLSYIDRNWTFSEYSVKALWSIKNCGFLFSTFVVAGTLYVMLLMKGDRAGILMLGLLGTFVSIVIASFAAVLQKLLIHAIEIKSENELIV